MRARRVALALCAAAWCGVVAACGGAGPTPAGGTGHGTAAERDSLPNHQMRITRAEMGGDWPFTVEDGVLEAVPRTLAIVFHANGKTYGVNGIARGVTNRSKYADIDEIMATEAGHPEVKKDIGPVIRLGNKLQDRR